MSDKSEKVKSGYADLDYTEREDVKKFIEDFDKKSFDEKKAINEKFSRIVRNKSLGPTSSASCPCCGR